MNKYLFFLFVAAMLTTTSCTVEEIDSDLTTPLVGSYTMDTYETQFWYIHS